MKNYTLKGFLFMIVLSVVVFSIQVISQTTNAIKASPTGLRGIGRVIAPPIQPNTFTDSCNHVTISDDDTIPFNGYSYNVIGDSISLGNYFPVDSNTSGIIKSVDMYFSSNSNSSAQTCNITFYKADKTTIFGRSGSFINTGAPWPGGTWVNVSCPDIPFTGPFYAMVDYSILSLPEKNFFDVNICPIDYGFVQLKGVWGHTSSTFSDCDATFLERINICNDFPLGIKNLSTESISVYPNPTTEAINLMSATDIIKEIEILNYLGQSVYQKNNVNLKSVKVDVSHFKAGQYFVRIISTTEIKTMKFTIIH
jgi:hypothetical protein